MEPYTVDYDWAWGAPHSSDPITLRAHLTFADAITAQKATEAFLDNLMAENGFHGSGGWAARTIPAASASARIIDFTAGGEDVADAISYAAEDAFEHFEAYPGTSIRWEQLPYNS